MRVWITKYALTTGIFSREVDEPKGEFAEMVKVDPQGDERHPQYFHGKDWHTTEDAAVARAESMRAAKVASHKKAIAKLESIGFRQSLGKIGM